MLSPKLPDIFQHIGSYLLKYARHRHVCHEGNTSVSSVDGDYGSSIRINPPLFVILGLVFRTELIIVKWNDRIKRAHRYRVDYLGLSFPTWPRGMICSASRRVYYVHNPISMETPEGSATAKLSESEHSRIDLDYGRSLRSLHQLDCSSARTHGTVAFSGSLPCLLLFQPDFTLLCHLSTRHFVSVCSRFRIQSALH